MCFLRLDIEMIVLFFPVALCPSMKPAGAYTQLLNDLVELEPMLKLQNISEPHMRMRDRELCLRFFAMLRTSPYGFRTPVKAWLNEEIREHQNMSEDEADKLKTLFEMTASIAWEVFGTKFCRNVRGKKAAGFLASLQLGGAADAANQEDATEVDTSVGNGEINVAQWDTIMYSFGTRIASCESSRMAALMSENSAAIRNEWFALVGDPAFKKSLLSNAKSVTARHEMWDERLTRILGSGAD